MIKKVIHMSLICRVFAIVWIIPQLIYKHSVEIMSLLKICVPVLSLRYPVAMPFNNVNLNVFEVVYWRSIGTSATSKAA